MTGRAIGGVTLSVEGVSLAFGGVKALTDVSFDVREHEVRAIIGPNGAGKSSMLNVLNGVYHPQNGRIRFQGREFADMDSHVAAEMGIARTFQNIALFKGMSVLDNIMTGRNLKMRCGFLRQALWLGPAKREVAPATKRIGQIVLSRLSRPEQCDAAWVGLRYVTAQRPVIAIEGRERHERYLLYRKTALL